MKKQKNKNNASSSKKHKEVKGMSIDNPTISPIDMLLVLSQIVVKVPLLELLRIPKHKSKAIAWAKGVDDNISHDCNSNQICDGHEKELGNEVVVSQNPPMYLDDSVNQCLGSVKRFL